MKIVPGRFAEPKEASAASNDERPSQAKTPAVAVRAITLLERFQWLGILSLAGATGREIRVAYALADSTFSDTGRCSPDIETIAAKAGEPNRPMDRRNVHRCIETIKRLGFLHVVSHAFPTKNGQWVNGYELWVPAKFQATSARTGLSARKATSTLTGLKGQATSPLTPIPGTRNPGTVYSSEPKGSSSERAGAGAPSHADPSGDGKGRETQRIPVQDYQPSQALIKWAAKHRPDLDALDKVTLGKFRAHRAEKGLEVWKSQTAADAAYQKWLLDELPKSWRAAESLKGQAAYRKRNAGKTRREREREQHEAFERRLETEQATPEPERIPDPDNHDDTDPIPPPRYVISKATLE